MTDADVAKASEALQLVYRHTLDHIWHGHEMCRDADPATFDLDADKTPLPEQTCKLYREAGAETGEHIITHG